MTDTPPTPPTPPTTIRAQSSLPRDLLTVDQVANHLHVSVSTVRNCIRQDTLKAFRVAGLRKVLIPREAMMALLKPARAAEM